MVFLFWTTNRWQPLSRSPAGLASCSWYGAAPRETATAGMLSLGEQSGWCGCLSSERVWGRTLAHGLLGHHLHLGMDPDPQGSIFSPQ